MKRLLLIILSILLVSCGVHVNYDYDKTTNFSNYVTYNYFNDMQTGLSELDEKRLIRALDSVLQLKGYLYSDEPDFFINILSQEYQKAAQNTVGVGIGGTNRNVGGGVSIGIPVGGGQFGRQIQFDFVDSQKDLLFWQAVSESDYRVNASPSVREEQLQKIVGKVLSKFPPE